MSVPAQAPVDTPTPRRNTPRDSAPRNPVATALEAVRDGAVTDRGARIFTLIALGFPTAEVDVPTLAALLPLTEQQVGNVLGELVAAGLLNRRMRVVGYRESDGARIRRYGYTLAGGAQR